MPESAALGSPRVGSMRLFAAAGTWGTQRGFLGGNLRTSDAGARADDGILVSFSLIFFHTLSFYIMIVISISFINTG